MAITTQFLTGFEHGFVATAAAAGTGLFNTVTAGCSASTSSPRNGAYCLRIVAPANTAARVVKDSSVSGSERFSERFAVKVSSRPSSGTAVIVHGISTTSTEHFTISVSSTGVLSAKLGPSGTPIDGPTIDTTNWHLIEIMGYAPASVLRWRVDGVEQTAPTGGIGGTGFTRSFGLGTHLATQPAFTAEYDDWIIGDGPAAWPIEDWYGDGKVLAQRAGVDGTHSAITSFSPGDAGAAYSGTPTNVNTMVDDPPGTLGWTATRSTTDNIALRTASVGAYVEIKPAPTAETGQANAVRAIMSYSSPATQANLAACDVLNELAGTPVEIWGLVNGVGKDYSETANQFKGIIVPRPALGWTVLKVNDVRFRFGGPNAVDISPVPTVQALMLEVDWPVFAQTPYDIVIDVDNPISHYKLGASTTEAVDRKNVRTLTAQNGPIATASGLLINNSDDFANSFVGASSQNFASGASSISYNQAIWSFEAWIKPTTITNSTIVRLDGSPQQIFLFPDGTIQLGVLTASGTVFLSTAAGVIVAGRTYHIVGVSDGTNGNIYINGKLVVAQPAVGIVSVANAPIRIAGTGGYNGVIDEVAWYGSALSPARVLAHFQAGSLKSLVFPGGGHNDSRRHFLSRR